jgi:hypothetical protein
LRHAAFEVGYESASQFNRAYSRLYGSPLNPLHQGPAAKKAGVRIEDGQRLTVFATAFQLAKIKAKSVRGILHPDSDCGGLI